MFLNRSTSKFMRTAVICRCQNDWLRFHVLIIDFELMAEFLFCSFDCVGYRRDVINVLKVLTILRKRAYGQERRASPSNTLRVRFKRYEPLVLETAKHLSGMSYTVIVGRPIERNGGIGKFPSDLILLRELGHLNLLKFFKLKK